ncbi:hypothetical protein ACA910_003072 [Epithemia clementina (nom. ined.)]
MFSTPVLTNAFPRWGRLAKAKPLNLLDSFHKHVETRVFSSFERTTQRGNLPRGNYGTRRLPRSRLLQPGRHKRAHWHPGSFGLRQNAVSVFPGDFGDNEDLKEGAEHEWRKPDKSEEEEDEEKYKEAKKLKETLREEAKAKEALRQKRIERALNPRPHLTKIDERGCAYGRGARKAASARVWIQPGLGEIIVNRKEYAEYFVRETLREHIIEPFVITETLGQFDVTATVTGGGLSGQAGAIRLGIARGLNNYNPDLYRPPLKYKKLLKRDSRAVERKKIGKVKARKSPQWSKR